MGWDFATGATKRDVVNDIKARWGQKLLAAQLVGNQFWVVVQPENEPKPAIGLYLLDKNGRDGWGEKNMWESMHPYYYDCPVGFLDLAPETSGAWRQKVRTQAALTAALATAKRGDMVRVGARVYRIVSRTRNGFLARKVSGDDGRTYRIPSRLIEKLVTADAVTEGNVRPYVFTGQKDPRQGRHVYVHRRNLEDNESTRCGSTEGAATLVEDEVTCPRCRGRAE
jgi:hypothetical protein